MSRIEAAAGLPLFDQREETLRFHPDSCLTESARSTRRRTFIPDARYFSEPASLRRKGAKASRAAREHVEGA